jgi:hypothetical protein
MVAQAHTITPPKVVPSNIMGVTVFLQGAQVTRNALTTLDLGKTELVFRGISPQIDPQSIQVKGDGAFTILSVQHQINYLEEQKPRSEVEQLKTTQKQLMDKRRLQNVGLEVCKNEQSVAQQKPNSWWKQHRHESRRFARSNSLSKYTNAANPIKND